MEWMLKWRLKKEEHCFTKTAVATLRSRLILILLIPTKKAVDEAK